MNGVKGSPGAMEGFLLWKVERAMELTPFRSCPQALTNGCWNTNTQISHPLWDIILRHMFYSGFQSFPSTVKTLVAQSGTLLIMHPSLAVIPSPSPSTGVFSQINYLCSDLCVRACFWENPNQNKHQNFFFPAFQYVTFLPSGLGISFWRPLCYPTITPHLAIPSLHTPRTVDCAVQRANPNLAGSSQVPAQTVSAFFQRWKNPISAPLCLLYYHSAHSHF